MPQQINVTPLMAVIMDALCQNSAVMTLKDLATSVTDFQNGIPVTGSQLVSPLGRLRKLKWVRRTKTEVGKKRVGHAEYPVIARFYNVTPNGRRIWKAMGHTISRVAGGKLDAFEVTGANIEVEDRGGRPFAVATVNPAHFALRPTPEEKPTPPKHEGEKSFKPSKGKLFGHHLIHTDGSPYMRRIWFGRLRLHIFYRGDGDDPHDHPWDFKTFPLTPYVEEIFFGQGEAQKRVVPAWRWSYRKAEFRHRVVGRYDGTMRSIKENSVMRTGFPVPDHQAAHMSRHGTWEPGVKPGKIVTIVWRGRERREWGFWLRRAGRFCFQAWPDVRDKGFKEHCD